MNRETETKVAIVLAAARWIESGSAQEFRTPEQLAALSKDLGEPVSKNTFDRLLTLSKAKALHACRQHGIGLHSLRQNPDN